MRAVRSRLEWWMAVALALAAGFAVAIAMDWAAQPANAQASAVKVTPQQLLINQRISQAGVRRANEALTRLDLIAATPPTPGPTGPTGPAGPAGPVGPAGAPGEAGGLDLSLITVETEDQTIPGGETGTPVEVTCPEGAVAISGGIQTTNDNISPVPLDSFRSAEGTWTFHVRNGAGSELTLTYQAVCVAATAPATP